MAKRGSTRVVVCLDETAKRQIDALGRVFNVGQSSIVAQAVARWYLTEPLVEKMKSGEDDVSDHPRVPD